MGTDDTLPEGRGLAGLAVRERKAIISNNIAKDPRITLKQEASVLPTFGEALVPVEGSVPQFTPTPDEMRAAKNTMNKSMLVKTTAGLAVRSANICFP